MEVRKGFKQTEVGIIPEDWVVSTITQAAEMTTVGFVGSMSHLFTPNGIPVLRGQDILPNKLDATDTKFISQETHKLWKKSALRSGDVVMVRVGVGAGISCVIPSDLGEANAASLVVIRPSVKRLYAKFLSMVINSEFGKRQVESLLVGGAQPVINTATVAAFKFPLPPTLAEQEAIAEALSDADALIESLETLLAKKRQVKQGAMSELLRGKRRVVESGAWEVKKLGELLDFERPDKYIVESTEYLENGSVPVLTANKSFVLGYTDEEFGIYENLPVIIFDDFTTDKKFVDFPFKVKSSAIKILKPKSNKVNLRYIFERMQLIRFSLGDHKRYYISEYQHIQIEMPSLAEQTAIAEILSDMDAEIRAVEEKLSKARAVKAGMMSALLTGRVRLV